MNIMVLTLLLSLSRYAFLRACKACVMFVVKSLRKRTACLCCCVQVAVIAMLLFEYEHGRRGIPRCAREIRLYGFVGSAIATTFELLSVRGHGLYDARGSSAAGRAQVPNCGLLVIIIVETLCSRCCALGALKRLLLLRARAAALDAFLFFPTLTVRRLRKRERGRREREFLGETRRMLWRRRLLSRRR